MSTRTGKRAELYDDPFAWLGAAFRIAFVRYQLGKLREERKAIAPTFDETTPPEDRRPWTAPLHHLARASASLGRLSDHLQQPLPPAETNRRRKRARKAKRTPAAKSAASRQEKRSPGALSAGISTTPPAPLDDPPQT